MRTAIFPGTFDPPTLGHLDIAKRAAKLFDHLYIAIGKNIRKTPSVFTAEERMEMLKKVTEHIPNIEIVLFDGLLVDFVNKMDIQTIIRSIRNFSDFEHEVVMAQMNWKIGKVETLYIVPDEEFQLISSSLVRELAWYGRRVDQFVPSAIEPFIFDRLRKKE